MPETISIDQRVAELSRHSFGLVMAKQLRLANVTRSAVRLRVTQGRWQRVFPGVYFTASAPLSREALLLAATWASGAGATISRETAAVVHGIWDRPTNDDVHVSCRHTPRASTSQRVHFHERAMSPQLPTSVVNRVRVDSPLMTCLDLGHTLSKYQIAYVIAEATFRRKLDVDALARSLEERKHAPGSAAVRAGLELHRSGSAGTRSTTEDRLIERIECLRMAIPQVNVRGATGVRGIEADLVWRRQLLIVEVDGWSHDQPGARAFDAGKDQLHRDAGWTVLRFSAEDVWRDLPRVIQTIQAHLDA